MTYYIIRFNHTRNAYLLQDDMKKLGNVVVIEILHRDKTFAPDVVGSSYSKAKLVENVKTTDHFFISGTWDEIKEHAAMEAL